MFDIENFHKKWVVLAEINGTTNQDLQRKLNNEVKSEIKNLAITILPELCILEPEILHALTFLTMSICELGQGLQEETIHQQLLARNIFQRLKLLAEHGQNQLIGFIPLGNFVSWNHLYDRLKDLNELKDSCGQKDVDVNELRSTEMRSLSSCWTLEISGLPTKSVLVTRRKKK